MIRKSIPNLSTLPDEEKTTSYDVRPAPLAVFLDVGDTLLAPYPSFSSVFAAGCREVGCEIATERLDELAARVGAELAALRQAGRSFSVSETHSRAFWQGFYERFLGECDVRFPPDLPAQLYERFRRTESYRAFPDVLRALRELQGEGLILGIISNWEDWLERLLGELGLLPFFSAIVVSGVEGREKPDPELFRQALERAGVAAERAVHVGDSPASDCAPAAAAGMEAVLLDRDGRYPESPYRRVRDLAQLAAWLRMRCRCSQK